MIEALRRTYRDKPFTKYEARQIYNAPSDYVTKVFKMAKELGILKPAEKCVCRPAYRIDPDESGRLRCSLDNKPYEDSICPTFERLIERCAKEKLDTGDSACERDITHLARILKNISQG